jgi:CheY-like chemotaxis protein
VTIRTGTTLVSPENVASVSPGADLPCGEYAVLEVVDTGVGMDEETLRRVLDPFFSTKFPGRGLGLAAAFGIVRGHRGAIHVLSLPGQGATFRVLLPRCAPLTSREVRALTRPLLRTPGGTVLLVDDELAVLESSTLILQEAGYTVLTATDGDRALEVFASHRADLVGVLLDLSMPRRDGLETLRSLRQLAPRLPVVLCSGFGEQDVADRFRGLDVDGFLKKRYEMADLLGVLQRVLGARDPARG